MEEMERLRMTSVSIRVEMKNMNDKLQKQEEEVLRIGIREDILE